jgi:hypothetical protein
MTYRVKNYDEIAEKKAPGTGPVRGEKRVVFKKVD